MLKQLTFYGMSALRRKIAEETSRDLLGLDNNPPIPPNAEGLIFKCANNVDMLIPFDWMQDALSTFGLRFGDMLVVKGREEGCIVVAYDKQKDMLLASSSRVRNHISAFPEFTGYWQRGYFMRTNKETVYYLQ